MKFRLQIGENRKLVNQSIEIIKKGVQHTSKIIKGLKTFQELKLMN